MSVAAGAESQILVPETPLAERFQPQAERERPDLIAREYSTFQYESLFETQAPAANLGPKVSGGAAPRTSRNAQGTEMSLSASDESLPDISEALGVKNGQGGGAPGKVTGSGSRHSAPITTERFGKTVQVGSSSDDTAGAREPCDCGDLADRECFERVQYALLL